MSDHAAIFLTITMQANKGKSLWKLNNSLLQDTIFVEMILRI